jgi:hypothetical protein
MSCDAVAVAGAEVAAEHLRIYLTPDTITAPITAYLQAKWPQAYVQAQRYADEVSWIVATHGQTQRIAVRAGQVTVTNYTQDPAAAQALAAEIQQALTAIAGAYWQQATYQFLVANYALTESRPTADGSLVVRLRV